MIFSSSLLCPVRLSAHPTFYPGGARVKAARV